MSAETLRKAAALMRERAEAAERDCSSTDTWTVRALDDGRTWIMPAGHPLHDYAPTAEHIASWHPALAPLVANWLDRCVHRDDAGEPIPDWSDALAVARAYLGESA